MDGPRRSYRLQIMLTKGESAAVDNWRFQKRMPSRAAAVRELLKRGLSSENTNAEGTDSGMSDRATRKRRSTKKKA